MNTAMNNESQQGGTNFMIEWDEMKMSTGFPEIDAQHKEWLARFSEFGEAVKNNKGKDALVSAIFFFLRYSNTHFDYEESIMKQFHCPTEAVNKAEHEAFRLLVDEVMEVIGYSGGSMKDVARLYIALEKWLLNHICSVDGQLRNVAPLE